MRYDVLAEPEDVLALEPDVVIVATGGLPQLPEMEAGAEHVVTVWDILAGDVRPGDSVLLYDDDGTHSALSAAEVLARSGSKVEIVTPERTLGIEVGGMNHVPYARAFNETETTVTLNQRVKSVQPDDGRLRVDVGSDHSNHRTTRTVDQVVADHGTRPNADLYFDLKDGSSNLGEVDYDALINGRPQVIANNPDGAYQLFRIGDAVASRDIHAAIYDALRLMKDV